MNLSRFVVSLLIPFFAATLGSAFTTTNLPWYSLLTKSPLNPPNWIFGPVWTILYFSMGLSFYLIWQEKKSKQRHNAFYLYFTQLGLNLSWSFFFFSEKLPPLALIVILILWLAIALTIIKFYRLNKTAGIILVPYLLWVTFATYLNYQVVVLNPF